jgi:hypothetical protein
LAGLLGIGEENIREKKKRTSERKAGEKKKRTKKQAGD